MGAAGRGLLLEEEQKDSVWKLATFLLDKGFSCQKVERKQGRRGEKERKRGGK